MTAFSTAIGAYRHAISREESRRRAEVRLEAEAATPAPRIFYVTTLALCILYESPDVVEAVKWMRLNAPLLSLCLADNGARMAALIPERWDGKALDRAAASWYALRTQGAA